MKAVIFNSGLGNRMGELTAHSHKSMVRLLDGETVFHRQLRLLSQAGIREFIITTGPFAQQLEAEAADFPQLSFTFVPNPIYDKTNYIYSMYLARAHMQDDLLFLHGDLVFSPGLVPALLQCPDADAATVHFHKPLPEKDFKARVRDGQLLEVSIHIFDGDCYAFQPMYKLSRPTAAAWIARVEDFIARGEDKCYAENAFNEIFSKLNVRAFSCGEHYIEEIDNLEDYHRVAKEILPYD